MATKAVTWSFIDESNHDLAADEGVQQARRGPNIKSPNDNRCLLRNDPVAVPADQPAVMMASKWRDSRTFDAA
jgi:hypothetical protein